MECDQCGAPRPRTGPCPECGAPPPRFSMRGGSGGASGSGGRGRSQPGGASSGSQRKAGSGGGLLKRDFGGRQRGMGSDDGWDDDYSAPAPGRSGGRYPSGEYGGVDPSRALVPQYDEVMPPAAEGGLMGGLPGFPQTDEEERAIGMRRPAYIPATEPKRKRKLSSGRVLSGVLSILVVTVGVCGGLGFLGQQQIAKLIGGPLRVVVAQPTVDLSQIPATPAATAGPAAKVITSVTTARGIDQYYNAVDITSEFTVNSTVYVVANIVGAPQNTTNTLSCVWYLDGINYQLKAGNTKTLPPSKSNNFHAYCALPYLQTGVGMVRVYWNRPSSDNSDSPTDPYLGQTIKFGVFAKLPGTPTPGKTGTAKPGAPTPSPTKKAFGVWRPEAWRSEVGVS